MSSFSASSLWRVECCPASAMLPASETLRDDSERGKKHHSMLEGSAPRDSIPEIAFAYDVATGAAREIGRGLQRRYGELGPTEIAGTADLLTVGPDHVVITDYKTGVGFMVAPPAKNLQLQFYALCAAKVYGRQSAVVEVQYEDSGEIETAEFDAFSFVEIETRIRSIWAAAMKKNPPIVEGDHCWRCPAFARCPVKTAHALALANGELPQDLTLELTPEAIARGWPKLRRIEKVLEKVKETYKAYAAEHPVPLGNGRFLGLVRGQKERLDGWATFTSIKEQFGQDVASAAVEVKASKASVERAIASLAPARGKGKFVSAAIEKIRSSGGTTFEPTTSIEEYQGEEHVAPVASDAVGSSR